MKQITTFMTEISDDFKVVVVNAIRTLCLKFPSKQGVMLTFLSGVLRDEGGYEFKRAVVEAIFDMIKFIKDSKEAGQFSPCPIFSASFQIPPPFLYIFLEGRCS
jgi:coatomer subunit gamma